MFYCKLFSLYFFVEKEDISFINKHIPYSFFMLIHLYDMLY